MMHITNSTSSEKTIDPLMARSLTLAQSFDFAGKILTIYFTRQDSPVLIGISDQIFPLRREIKRTLN